MVALGGSHKGALLYVGNVRMCDTMMLPMFSHISRLYVWLVFLPEVTLHTHPTMVKSGTLAQLAA